MIRRAAGKAAREEDMRKGNLWSKGSLVLTAAAALFTGLAAGPAAVSASAEMFPSPPTEQGPAAMGPQTAVLAGGCFWGMEGVFERLKGVTGVTSGYSGGEAQTAHYDMVGSGVTGHAESIKITFDPKLISYGTLLQVYFSVAHDPTQLNYQGPDHGSQYRSAIFYANDAQKRVAEEYIKKLDAARLYAKPIVTQVVPLKAFYPAEDYHQNFMGNNPDYPYIVYWDKPKVARLEKQYPGLIARK
jgi:peptide-methionine (S)-S-oxide reductase